MTERGSTRHGARIDEEMKSETASLIHGAPVESRAEPWRQMEAPGEGESEPDAIPARSEIEERSMLAVSLRPSAFPGDRARLVEMAQAEHASDEVMSWLDRLPGDVVFTNVQDVWDALGGMHEHRETFRAASEAAEPAPPPTATEPATATSSGTPSSSEGEGVEEGKALIELGLTIAADAGRLLLTAAVAVVGGVCESARAVARRASGLVER